MSTIKNKKIWVNWKYHKKDRKLTKVPYQANGKMASTTDPTTWGTYEEVTNNARMMGKIFDGVGIILGQESGVIGIDFDNKVEHQFVEEAKTYCELSPSGKGLHFLFVAKEPIELERNKKVYEDWSVEVYTGGRYFTYTGNKHTLSCGFDDMRVVDEKEFLDLIKGLGYPWKADLKPSPSPIAMPIGKSDEEVMRMMFGAKNGGAIRKLYDGDITAYNGDESAADYALCHHLAFWTGRDKDRMRTMWLGSPLGQRKKAQERKDYQDRTLDNAISGTAEVYTPPQKSVDEGEEGYVLGGGKDPRPMLIMENICRVFARDAKLKGHFRLNDFSHMVETDWEGDWKNLFDNAILEAQRHIQRTYEDFRAVSRAMVTDAIMAASYEYRVNPPRDYFKGLKWDGEPRLNSWLHYVYGVEDDELNQAIGSNWIKGLVKRVMVPGCQFDEVLALESKQGMRKSTSIRELGRPWHVETTHSVDDKDFYLVIAQNIIVEFSEGEIFDRASVKRIKSEVTKTEDQVRPPYERGMRTFKRSCVFCVTTNKLELKDDTGNRRWLPVELKKEADIDWIKDNREQMFAEAYHRVMVLGETTHEYPQDSLQELQHSRMEYNDLDEVVLNWYVNDLSKEKREEGFSLSDVYSVAYPNQQLGDKRKEWELASVLRRCLHLDNRSCRINGTVRRRWSMTDKTKKIVDREIAAKESLSAKEITDNF